MEPTTPPNAATERAIGEFGAATWLADFGNKVLEDLLQGEWEPDYEWHYAMLEHAEKIGLVRSRRVQPGDDVSDDYDFVWERVSANDPDQR